MHAKHDIRVQALLSKLVEAMTQEDKIWAMLQEIAVTHRFFKEAEAELFK